MRPAHTQRAFSLAALETTPSTCLTPGLCVFSVAGPCQPLQDHAACCFKTLQRDVPGQPSAHQSLVGLVRLGSQPLAHVRQQATHNSLEASKVAEGPPPLLHRIECPATRRNAAAAALHCRNYAPSSKRIVTMALRYCCFLSQSKSAELQFSTQRERTHSGHPPGPLAHGVGYPPFHLQLCLHGTCMKRLLCFLSHRESLPAKYVWCYLPTHIGGRTGVLLVTLGPFS